MARIDPERTVEDHGDQRIKIVVFVRLLQPSSPRNNIVPVTASGHERLLIDHPGQHDGLELPRNQAGNEAIAIAEPEAPS